MRNVQPLSRDPERTSERAKGSDETDNVLSTLPLNLRHSRKKIGTKNVLDLHATAVASATAIISVNNREEVQTSSA